MKEPNQMGMWHWAWWSRRVRRLAPFAVVILFLYIIYMHTMSVEDEKGVQEVMATRTSPSPDLGLVTWVVVAAHGGRAADTCDKALNFFNSWTVLVYGVDQPDANSVSRCQYLPNPDSPVWSELGISQVSLMPVLLQAYLYAIKKGAEAIYIPTGLLGSSNMESMIIPRSYEGLMYAAESKHFNAEDHFGCRKPEGTSQQKPHNRPVYDLCQHHLPAVHAPAHITIPHFTVAQDGTGRTQKVPPCDKRAPPVTLHFGVLADIDLQGALYTSDAFWALAVQAVATKAHSVALGYTIQKLLHVSGQRVMVHYNQALTETYLEGSTVGTTTYLNKLTQNLNQWSCMERPFMQCVRDLFTHLEGHGLLEQNLQTRLTVWWDALLEIGYNPPLIIVATEESDLKCSNGHVSFHPVDRSLKVPWKRYQAQPYQTIANAELITATFHNTCSGYKIETDPVHNVNFTHPWSQSGDTLLIVIFNHPHYEAIPYVELLYRPFFPSLVYCGPGQPDLQKFPQLAGFKITFLSYEQSSGHTAGAFNYECVVMAMQMHYDVKGFLVTSDDLFFVVSRIITFSDQAVWFLPKEQVKIGELTHLMECRLGNCDFYPHWAWWGDYQAQTLFALAELKQRHHYHYIFYHCYRQLFQLTGGDGRANGGFSDIYYIPQRLATEFSTMARFFKEKQVFLEIAVPSILGCLELPEKVKEMKGFQNWDLSRDRPWEYKKSYRGLVFFHPVKWGHLVAGNQKMAELLCTSLLPYLHDPFGRMKH